MNHERTARVDRNQFASVNHGRPAVTSMNRVGGKSFDERGQGRKYENNQHFKNENRRNGAETANRENRKMPNRKQHPYHSKE